MSMRLRWTAYLLLSLLVVAVLAYVVFSGEPWSTVLAIRHEFNLASERQNAALAKHLPPDVASMLDRRYGESSRDLLDVYFPARVEKSGQALATIVWFHGGIFVSGDKSDSADYLKILAGHGYTAISVGYSLAPGAHYPRPVVEGNNALAFLVRNAKFFHVDPARLFLAGDMAGAQIAAQLAEIVSSPDYAKDARITPAISRAQLRGVVLFGGLYDPSMISVKGGFETYLRAALWSYFGTRDYMEDWRLPMFAANRHVDKGFPPTFVSAGNGDPLLSQSTMMAGVIRSQGVPVDALFFPAKQKPALQQGYQFDLDRGAGREALGRLTAFLARLSTVPPKSQPSASDPSRPAGHPGRLHERM